MSSADIRRRFARGPDGPLAAIRIYDDVEAPTDAS